MRAGIRVGGVSHRSAKNASHVPLRSSQPRASRTTVPGWVVVSNSHETKRRLSPVTVANTKFRSYDRPGKVRDAPLGAAPGDSTKTSGAGSAQAKPADARRIAATFPLMSFPRDSR